MSINIYIFVSCFIYGWVSPLKGNVSHVKVPEAMSSMVYRNERYWWDIIDNNCEIFLLHKIDAKLQELVTIKSENFYIT